MPAFHVPEKIVAPFEYLTMAAIEGKAIGPQFGSKGNSQWERDKALRNFVKGDASYAGTDRMGRDAVLHTAVDRARQEGYEAGNLEGRRVVRSEMEPEMHASVARERERLIGVVKEFGSAREHYFTGVEQEVVKLALGIAERVLHREAQIDPILLAGVVRVALEKMADRSGVVLQVSQEDVEAWKLVFHSEAQSERPRVVGDARLERGDCVLETKMGTVELGVSVQLEEIEKGFFDLLNHRPVQ
jgi:flagellar assembly protein FliH